MKCDELKAYTIYEGDVGNYTEHVVYSKSDADKVIAALEESHKKEVEQLLIEIVKLKKQVNDYAQGLYVIQARADKEACHHKYKRCLAMAEMCEARYNEEYAKENWRGLSWEYISKEMKYWKRWHKRWLELAEKFKEAK